MRASQPAATTAVSISDEDPFTPLLFNSSSDEEEGWKSVAPDTQSQQNGLRGKKQVPRMLLWECKQIPRFRHCVQPIKEEGLLDPYASSTKCYSVVKKIWSESYKHLPYEADKTKLSAAIVQKARYLDLLLHEFGRCLLIVFFLVSGILQRLPKHVNF